MDEKRAYPHGGDLYHASRIYGCKEEDFLDYSANINPLGVPNGLKERIISSLDSLVNYPDPECTLLREEISRYLCIPKENIVIGNGASEIIFLLFEVLNPKKVLIPAPAFSEYAKAAARYGTKVEYFELREEEGYRLNIDRLLGQLDGETDTLILCNPNNPTSALVDKKELKWLIYQAHTKNVNVLVDEAFIELTAGSNSNSIMDCVGQYGNLFIIRAFTKLLAIPGLRLGYGIGGWDIINKLWERKLPWSVNSLACCVGEFLGSSSGYLQDTDRWLTGEIDWFYEELQQIKGLKVFKPETNFVLVKLMKERWTSDSLKGELASRGILIRDASNFTFLNDRFVRFAIRDRKSNLRFLNVLKEVLA